MSKFIPTADGGAVNRDHVVHVLPPERNQNVYEGRPDGIYVEMRTVDGGYTYVGPFRHEWGAWEFVLNGRLAYLDTSRRDAKVEAARQKALAQLPEDERS